MCACQARATLCVQALLAAGANPSASVSVNGVAKTPMSFAKESKDRPTLALLVGGALAVEGVFVVGSRRFGAGAIRATAFRHLQGAGDDEGGHKGGHSAS